MDPNTPFQPTVIVPPAPRPRRSKTWLVILIIVIIAAVAVAGVYYWQHQKVSDLNSQLNASKQSSGQKTASPSQVSDTSVGYPVDKDFKVLLTFFAPTGDNILQTTPNYGSQNELNANFAEAYNDVMANWQFANSGTEATPSNSLQPNNQLSVTALNSWLAKDDPSTIAYSNYDATVPDAQMTIAQKTDFVNKLKQDTTACAQDSSKGFTTDDKVFSICYTLLHPQAENADWALSLSGFATVKDTPLYLRGSVMLSGGDNYQTSLNSYLAALKQFKTVTATKN